MDDRARLDARELARGWQAVLGRLELELNPYNITTWLAPARARSFDGAVLTLEARSAMACEYLDRRLRVVIERAAAHVFGTTVTLALVAAGETATEDFDAAVAPGAPASGTLAIGAVNCSLTFEDYLAAEGNRLAYQACIALVEPAEELVTSPVVLFGSPGMGKTHLLHALACRAKDMGRRVACLSAEEFTNRFQGALRARRADEFQDQIRTVDLLIVDDLQYIAGKTATQVELVCTMDAVSNTGGHIVVASERHPFELGLIDRLESRLSAGIITRVDPFEWQERRAFVEHVARRKRGGLPAWAIDRLAAVNAPSVRVLLGCVNAAMALERAQKLDMRGLDASLAGVTVLESAQAATGGEQDLLDRIARYFAIATEDLVGRSRSPRFNDARAVAAAALQKRGYSLPRIAAILSGRDKSTVSTLASRGRAMIEEQDILRHLLAG